MTKWKRIGVCAAALGMLLASRTSAADAAFKKSPHSYRLDGEACTLSGYLIQESNYISLHDAQELYRSGTGGDFHTLKDLTGSAEEVRMRLTKGAVTQYCSAYKIEDTYYYKLRDMAQLFGLGVSFDGGAGCVLFTTKADPAPAAPAPAKTPEPAPVTPAPVTKPASSLEAHEAVEASWFDDAAFIGDSTSLYLNFYVGDAGLGKATMLTAGSFSYFWSVLPVTDRSPHPLYQGTKLPIADEVAMSGVKKVFILLGMNDLEGGAETAIKNCTSMVNGILEKSQNVDIYLESVIPMIRNAGRSTTKLNNTVIYDFNSRLSQLASDNGWYYLDVASVLTDSDGYLIDDYCGDKTDMGLHPTMSAVGLEVEYIKTHVALD